MSLLSNRPNGPRVHLSEGKTRFGKRAVGPSKDLNRVLALPRREKPDTAKLAKEMTAKLRKENPNCKCRILRPDDPCITEFNEIQGWVLSEAPEVGGEIGAIGVGHGKTGIDIELAMVIPGVKTGLLLLPPNLKKQFEHDFEVWSQHFETPNLAGGSGTYTPGRPTIHILTYNELGHENQTAFLQTIDPEFIICDEVHKLKDLDAVSTDRFWRFLQAHPDTLCFLHSGSLTTRSVSDYAHLAIAALGEGSPLPIHPGTVAEWGTAIDPAPKDGVRAPAGALKLFCKPGETVLEGFSRRLGDTPGFIRTADNTLGLPPLYIDERKVKVVPQAIKDALKTARELWTRPDGEELVQATEVAFLCRQLSAGFFLRWKFPRGEPEELIETWFSARKAWNRELRGRLQVRTTGMDSPALCTNAASRWHLGYTYEGVAYPPHTKKGPLPVWEAKHWPAWNAVENEVYHETEAVWIDDFLARDAAEWAKRHKGIVWTENPDLGRRIAELTGLPYYGQSNDEVLNLNASEKMREQFTAWSKEERARGRPLPTDTAENWIRFEPGTRSIICSIDAHGTGKNLQRFHKALVTQPPADGGEWEQVIGREHRQGQKADEVRVWVYRHTQEMLNALDKARERARYMQGTLKNPHKLLYATYSFQLSKASAF